MKTLKVIALTIAILSIITNYSVAGADETVCVSNLGWLNSTQ